MAATELRLPAGFTRPNLRHALTPCEFAARLNAVGIYVSTRWVQRQCARRRIMTLPAFPTYFIPETELERMLSHARAEVTA